MVQINNCNNIDTGEISIVPDCLNIKYAINGTGKTTIAKAIECHFRDLNQGGNSIFALKPFKAEKDKAIIPSIIGLDEYTSVAIFNEDYINQFTFEQSGELMKGSFEIFVKDEKYIARMEEIDDLLKELVKSFQDDENLNVLIDDLTTFIKKAKANADGSMHRSSAIVKALDIGNIVQNIPSELVEYKDYIQGEDQVGRLGRILKGAQYVDKNSHCPCCVTELSTHKKETFTRLTQTYDKKKIEHLNGIISNFISLQNYLSEEAINNLNEILNKQEPITNTEESYVLGVIREANSILQNLLKIRSISFYSLKEAKDIKIEIDTLIIKHTLHSHFKGEELIVKVDPINEKLNKLIEDIGILNGKINRHKDIIRSTIESHKADINDFLEMGGYKYEIDYLEKQDGYSLVLMHTEKEGAIENAKNNLSFGERNAFALVLFMFDVLKKNTDLIILDDPISSFDKNKKFAIVNRLFGQTKETLSLRGKTVLMLTHDFEPIIDIVKNQLPKSLQKNEYNAYFLTNKSNVLEEKAITKEDILSCIQVAEKNINSLINPINKLIYCRRLFEITKGKESEAYQLLSNLFHKIEIPMKNVSGVTEKIKMEADEIAIGETTIRTYIKGFEYSSFYQDIIDNQKMLDAFQNSSSNYEKLQIYRIIKEVVGEGDGLPIELNSVIAKFINESFHIENDDLFQLNPCEFDTVPQYIIDKCNEDLLPTTNENE